MTNSKLPLFPAVCFLVGAALSLACADGAPAPTVVTSSPPELLFRSGFEGTTTIVPADGFNDQLIGRDDTFPDRNDWVKDMQEKTGFDKVRIEYTGGDGSKRFGRILREPGNPSNHVLWFWLNDSWKASENMVKARVQADFYGRKTGFSDFHQSVRVFLTRDWEVLKSYPQAIHWLTISEFWNDIYWGGKNGFRVTLGIGKPSAEKSELNFILDAQGPGMKRVWIAKNEKVKVPIGQWFTMDYYYKEGDDKTGRFYMAITPDGEARQIVYDVTGWTRNTTDPAPKGITDWNPMKLYTSKEIVGFVKARNQTLQIYWDDLELWTNRPPTDSIPTPVKP